MPKEPSTNRRQTASDAVAISDAAHVAHYDLFPAWSADFLLCNPKQAMELCRLVRSRLHRPKLIDCRILWTYLNARKRSRFARGAWGKEAD